jgi:transcription factor IIIB 90 kDa subunit
MKTLHWENKLLEPSIFIGRFVAMLEFGEDQNKVATDAARIAARFKEDWIHEGRRTAGICGAAIYLAAQMNNYRRSIQEIVQVAKIADTTIIKRLEEFSATPSANLTVGDFRVTKHPTEAADPPSFTRARVLEKEISEGPGSSTLNRRKRGQKRKRGDMEEDDQSYRSHTPSARESSVASEPLFLPSNESHHEDEGLDAPSNTRQRAVNRRLLESGIFEGVAPLSTEVIDIAEDDQMQGEAETERNGEISLSTANHRIPDDLVIDQAQIEEVREILESRTGQLALEDVRLTRESRRQEEEAQAAVDEEEDKLLDLDEEELDNYLCGDEEAQMRERVWTELNLDYLRKLAGRTTILILMYI